MTQRSQIESFLSQKRVAMIGVAREPKDFSRSLMHELWKRGYDVVPVNPMVSLIDERHCFASVKEITPPVTGALIMTKPEVTEDIVRECHAAGIKSVWLYRAVGAGAVSPNAVAYCREHHIDVIEGHCPFMFLPNPGFPHNLHRWFAKITGKLPK